MLTEPHSKTIIKIKFVVINLWFLFKLTTRVTPVRKREKRKKIKKNFNLKFENWNLDKPGFGASFGCGSSQRLVAGSGSDFSQVSGSGYNSEIKLNQLSGGHSEPAPTWLSLCFFLTTYHLWAVSRYVVKTAFTYLWTKYLPISYLFSLLSIYIWDLLLSELVPKVNPNINSVNPQLSNNQCWAVLTFLWDPVGSGSLMILWEPDRVSTI